MRCCEKICSFVIKEKNIVYRYGFVKIYLKFVNKIESWVNWGLNWFCGFYLKKSFIYVFLRLNINVWEIKLGYMKFSNYIKIIKVKEIW